MKNSVAKASGEGLEQAPVSLQPASVNTAKGRAKLLEETISLLDFSLVQVRAQKPIGRLKQSWVKTSAYLIQVAASVLKDAELEELKRRIELLERTRKED